jgi:phospholipase/carboxylesterase
MTEFGDGPRWGPASGGAARQLVLLLHGVGADGFDLIDLAPGWGRAVPDALFLAPHGPEPCDLAPYGRQWFSLADRAPGPMAAGAAAAAGLLGPWIAGQAAALGIPPASVAIMGFSQGCMAALATGLRMQPPVAGILGYSGALAGAGALADWIAARPPTCLVHGEADEVVPVGASRLAEATLRAAGVAVEATFRPGLGHTLDEVGIMTGALFLQRVLGARMTGV